MFVTIENTVSDVMFFNSRSHCQCTVFGLKFLPHDADYAMAVRLSVRPPVHLSHIGILSK